MTESAYYLVAPDGAYARSVCFDSDIIGAIDEVDAQGSIVAYSEEPADGDVILPGAEHIISATNTVFLSRDCRVVNGPRHTDTWDLDLRPLDPWPEDICDLCEQAAALDTALGRYRDLIYALPDLLRDEITLSVLKNLVKRRLEDEIAAVDRRLAPYRAQCEEPQNSRTPANA